MQFWRSIYSIGVPYLGHWILNCFMELYRLTEGVWVGYRFLNLPSRSVTLFPISLYPTWSPMIILPLPFTAVSLKGHKHSAFPTSHSFTLCKSRFCYHCAHSSTLTKNTNEPLVGKQCGNISDFMSLNLAFQVPAQLVLPPLWLPNQNLLLTTFPKAPLWLFIFSRSWS